jgi:predicted dehydrogenase
VLVDKPMAFTQQECDQLAAAVREGGGAFTYVHRLFSPAVQRLRALIEAGRLGLPWAVNIVWLAAGGLGGVTVENDALVADPRLSGGGELANFLGYPVGYLRYLTGLEVQTVYASTATHAHEPHRRFGVEDFGVVMLTLERDVLSTITVGRVPAGSAPGRGIYTLRVHGSHGSVLLDEERPELRVYQPVPTGTAVRVRYGDGTATAAALRGLLDDFVQAIDEGRPPLCGIDDGRALAAVLDASYASAASGRVVAVKRVTAREEAAHA